MNKVNDRAVADMTSSFMASSKVLGEEADAKAAGGVAQRDQSAASTRDDEGTST